MHFRLGTLSYPIHSRFSSEVPDVRSDQIRSTDPYRIRYDKLLHSYPVHITLNTAYFLHLVYPPFRFIGYAFFRLCSTDPFHLWLIPGYVYWSASLVITFRLMNWLLISVAYTLRYFVHSLSRSSIVYKLLYMFLAPQFEYHLRLSSFRYPDSSINNSCHPPRLKDCIW